MPDDNDMITAAEAAELLGVSRSYINILMVRENCGPVLEVRGRSRVALYPRDVVEAMRARREADPPKRGGKGTSIADDADIGDADLMTVRQAAARLGVSRARVYAMIRDGVLHVAETRIVCGLWRNLLPRAAVEAVAGARVAAPGKRLERRDDILVPGEIPAQDAADILGVRVSRLLRAARENGIAAAGKRIVDGHRVVCFTADAVRALRIAMDAGGKGR